MTLAAFSTLTKGVPDNLDGVRFADVVHLQLSLPTEQLPLPVLVLKRSALEHNLALMQAFCDEHRVLLAPHGKTSMAPALFDAQLEHGAWAITVANVQQVRVCRQFGVPRVVLANEVVGTPNLRILADEVNADDDFELYQWVDSADGVGQLARAHAAHGLTRPWRVLLELGWPGGRTGARGAEQISAVIEAVAASGGRVVLVGIAVFEGLLDIGRLDALMEGSAAPADPIEPFLAGVLDIARRLAKDGVLPDDFILSGGGSTSFDTVARVFGRAPAPARVVVRPGCYISHDDGMYLLASPFADQPRRLQPALELWSYVTSIPEPGLAFLGFGRRDVPYDHGLPVPIAHLRAGSSTRSVPADATVTELHDQHAALRYGGFDLHVGDRVVVGLSHPCGGFDRWQVIPIIDDDGVVVDAVRTYF